MISNKRQIIIAYKPYTFEQLLKKQTVNEYIFKQKGQANSILKILGKNTINNLRLYGGGHQRAGPRDHSGGRQLPQIGEAQLLQMCYPSYKDDGVDCLTCSNNQRTSFLSKSV